MPLDELVRNAGLEIEKHAVGSGGSATVHKAKVVEKIGNLPDEGSYVAIKEYTPSILSIDGQAERIKQEAELGQELQHSNLVKTYGLRSTESNEHILFLEWIEGDTLEDWYSKQPKPVEWEQIKKICLGIISGVSELHDNDVFHRDIKPENIMLRADGTAVLMDIGVAEITGDNEHTMHTLVKDFVGSVRYASPQFVMGEKFTARDDIYSLGATFYLLFTGKRPYYMTERKPVLPIQVVSNPPKVESLQGDIPAPMKTVLEACLNKLPERRPSLEALKDCLNNPDGAEFISTELSRQTDETRTFCVIEVMGSAGSFYADLAGGTASLDYEYTVVRKERKPINVPSYNRKIIPERFIAKAVLKHTYQNIGFFHVIGRRWVSDRSRGISDFFAPPTGRMLNEEMVNERVEVGDLVLKD